MCVWFHFSLSSPAGAMGSLEPTSPSSAAAASDDIATIKSTLADALKSLQAKNPGSNPKSHAQTQNDVIHKLEACQQLVQRLHNIHTGILSKFRLDGQVALVTGAGQGIGRGFGHALGEAGAKVAVADLNYESACNVASELRAKGIESIAIQVDVSSKQEAVAMVKKVVDTWGELHIACNNVDNIHCSNSAAAAAAEQISEAEWNKMVGVNLNGVFFCCQAEGEHMLGRGYGKIINTASSPSSSVVHPQKQTQVAYNVCKAGVTHLTRTLATEWAGRGVRVNSISPGLIDTTALTPGLSDVHSIPMGRLGSIDELTGAIVYLASPLSDYMTGHDLVIDGGGGGGFSCR